MALLVEPAEVGKTVALSLSVALVVKAAGVDFVASGGDASGALHLFCLLLPAFVGKRLDPFALCL